MKTDLKKKIEELKQMSSLTNFYPPSKSKNFTISDNTKSTEILSFSKSNLELSKEDLKKNKFISIIDNKDYISKPKNLNSGKYLKSNMNSNKILQTSCNSKINEIITSSIQELSQNTKENTPPAYLKKNFDSKSKKHCKSNSEFGKFYTNNIQEMPKTKPFFESPKKKNLIDNYKNLKNSYKSVFDIEKKTKKSYLNDISNNWKIDNKNNNKPVKVQNSFFTNTQENLLKKDLPQSAKFANKKFIEFKSELLSQREKKKDGTNDLINYPAELEKLSNKIKNIVMTYKNKEKQWNYEKKQMSEMIFEMEKKISFYEKIFDNEK